MSLAQNYNGIYKYVFADERETYPFDYGCHNQLQATHVSMQSKFIHK